MIHHLRKHRILPNRMNALRDLRVKDEPFRGAAAIANARNGVVIDNGAGFWDGGAGGALEEGRGLVGVIQQSITPSEGRGLVWV
jgi:hypothetical protein